MADFVHITGAGPARRMRRTGIAARSHGRAGGRGVYCMPVLPSFTLTHQWVRELRRWHPGVLAAVHLRVPDDERVTVGHYGAEPVEMTAAQAVATVRGLSDPRGHEVFVPRAIASAEVRRVRDVPQGMGWRYQPGAHGRRPCPCPVCLRPGTFKVARLRRRFDEPESPSAPKGELMARLRAATTADEIVDVLWELGRRRRGGAEELAYLVDHPDPDVRDALHSVLRVYRGPGAKRLQSHIVLAD
ncbi:HEAT repeat domain-containing protein [Asanoa sp. WMMD1127]|uniref:HEAT repeat domain-containing protein n=1 Tax=Asanoa sp. WMMD1127 TaxID=3016107 RepID=UPI002415EFF7|nr:HEAT repeat domain-containing protein [Asanoa sp. WMMD1127]MDG4826416.1 HEAT repeat domain-containing protein [Asanoa sp. WMMD1127]